MSIHLNFLFEFTLSRQGMINEIERELDVIKTAMIANQFGAPFEVRQRIMVMPLRKLLCELGEKNDLIRKVCPDFKMPPIEGLLSLDEVFPGEPSLHMWASNSIHPMNKWVLLEDWLQSTIAFFDEVAEESFTFPVQLFDSIINQLKGNEKSLFLDQFHLENRKFNGVSQDVYVQTDQSEDKIKEISSVLHKAGYYSTTVERFIKHMSDKRGAHIDVGFAQMFNVINGTEQSTITTIERLSIFLIIAVMKQITELSNYYPEVLKKVNL